MKELAGKLGRSEDELAAELSLFENVGLVDLEEDEEGQIRKFERARFSKIRAEAEVGRSRISWEVEIGAAA